MDDIRNEYPSATINEAGKFNTDIYTQMISVVEDPAAYGFDNVSDPAIEAIAEDPDADISGYFFWDSVHPTARAHALLGENMVVPEPSSVILVLVALFATLFVRWGKLGTGHQRRS